MNELEQHLERSSAKIASIVGRYYAMDRDNRWERVKVAYDLLVHGKGTPSQNLIQSMLDSYKEGVTDEFMQPIVKVDADGQPIATIQDGDVVICFNFRTDRGREITQALTQHDFHALNMHKLNLHYLTLTNYDDTFAGVTAIFEKDNLNNTLGEVLAAARQNADPHCRNREIPARYVLLLGRARRRSLRAKSASCALRPKWPPTTCSPR